MQLRIRDVALEPECAEAVRNGDRDSKEEDKLEVVAMMNGWTAGRLEVGKVER